MALSAYGSAPLEPRHRYAWDMQGNDPKNAIPLNDLVIPNDRVFKQYYWSRSRELSKLHENSPRPEKLSRGAMQVRSLSKVELSSSIQVAMSEDGANWMQSRDDETWVLIEFAMFRTSKTSSNSSCVNIGMWETRLLCPTNNTTCSSFNQPCTRY